MPFWEYVNTFSDRCIMMNKISLVSLVVQSSISYLFSTKLNLNQRPSVCDNEFHSNKKVNNIEYISTEKMHKEMLSAMVALLA